MSDIRTRLMAVCDRLDEYHKEAKAIKSQMADLESQGIICARLHWPKDKPGALELLYSSNSEYARATGRRRQYIGKDPLKQEAAKASIQRWKEHRKLGNHLGNIQRSILGVERRLDALEQVSMGYEVRW